MMPTASAPSAAMRAVDHGFDRRQRVAAVAEQGVGGQAHVPEFEVAGAAAAEPRKIARARGRRVPGGTRNRQSLPGAPLSPATRAETMICAGGVAVEHGGLVAVEAPAVRRLRRRGLDIGEIEARRRVPNARTPDTANRRRSSAAAPASAPRCRIPRSARRRSRRSRDRARRRARARTLPSGCRSRSRRRRARHRLPRSAAPASRARRTASRSRR